MAAVPRFCFVNLNAKVHIWQASKFLIQALSIMKTSKSASVLITSLHFCNSYNMVYRSNLNTSPNTTDVLAYVSLSPCAFKPLSSWLQLKLLLQQRSRSNASFPATSVCKLVPISISESIIISFHRSNSPFSATCSCNLQTLSRNLHTTCFKKSFEISGSFH